MASGRPAARAAGRLISNPALAASVMLTSVCAVFFGVKALAASSLFSPPAEAPATVSLADVMPVQPTHVYTTTTVATTAPTAAPRAVERRFARAELLWPTAYPQVQVEGIALPAEYGDGRLDAEAVFYLLNQIRISNGLSPFVRADENAGEAARVRAAELLVSFSQTRPNGMGYATALSEAGVEYSYAMESVGYGQYTAGHIVGDWMKSEENVRNILDPICENIYIHCLVGGDNVPVWVLVGYGEVISE